MRIIEHSNHLTHSKINSHGLLYDFIHLVLKMTLANSIKLHSYSTLFCLKLDHVSEEGKEVRDLKLKETLRGVINIFYILLKIAKNLLKVIIHFIIKLRVV